MLLPEVENLEYRFCPGCGTEISAEPKKLDDAFQTIPPDLSAQSPGQKITTSDPDPGLNAIRKENLNDKTIVPQPMTKLRQPHLKPPDTPPPPGFHRTRSIEKPHLPRSEKNAPPKRIIHKRSAAKNRNILIVSLVVLALIILVLGGLFTF